MQIQLSQIDELEDDENCSASEPSERIPRRKMIVKPELIDD